jgi:hypothetical protein
MRRLQREVRSTSAFTITNIISSTIFFDRQQRFRTSSSLSGRRSILFYLFDNQPVSLGPGQTLPDIDAFMVTIAPSALPGLYDGSFGLIGGASNDAMDQLGSANFQVDTSK